jgi:hypothetical protein
MTQNINELFGNAMNEGAVSDETLCAIQVEDLGAQIQAGLGISPDDVQASEVVLVTIMPDDSGSIRFSGNAQVVRDGHNLVLEALGKSKQNDGILVHTRYLNGDVLYPYAQLEQAVRMTPQNYDPDKGTPLYDQTAVVLATVLAKAQEFEDVGVPCRSVTLIITDGQDEHSPTHRGGRGTTAKDVAMLVRDMLVSERHIIAAMGIGDPGTFTNVFTEMGVIDRWILTPGHNESEIRRAFQVFSQSAVRASQNAGSFSQMALGGFGA